MYIYIDNQDLLNDLCLSLKKEKIITFDTEFIGEKSYVAKLALIQIATCDQKNYIIDPINNIDLKGFLDILQDDKILKIVHACYQDIALFYKNFNVLPKNIWDTQLAESFLSDNDSISYANIVLRRKNKIVDKQSKLTNWLARPLTKDQLSYAISDVIYLFDIYQQQLAELEKKGRLDWFYQETKSFIVSENFEIKLDDIWRKIASRGNDNKNLIFLQALAIFREKLAKKANKPRKLILKDETLVKIAKLKPTKLEHLDQDRYLKNHLPKQYLKEIIKICNNVDLEKKVIKNKNKKLSKDLKAIAELLKILLKWTAEKYNIASKNIALSSDIDKYVINNDNLKFNQEDWKYEIFGKLAKDFSLGKTTIQIVDNKVEIKNNDI